MEIGAIEWELNYDQDTKVLTTTATTKIVALTISNCVNNFLQHSFCCSSIVVGHVTSATVLPTKAALCH